MRRQSPDQINPGHHSIRMVLRVAGPLLVITGILLFADVFTSFHEEFIEEFEKPLTIDFPIPGTRQSKKHEGLKMGQAILGMICFALGGAATRFGYKGALARYTAAEYAPVVSDTANYVARGASEGIREMSSAIAEGIRGEAQSPCPDCGTPNDVDARFCDDCGKAMNSTIECAACHEENDADAKFCKACGEGLTNG